MAVAQKWLKPGLLDFLQLFIIKFSTNFENLTIVAFMGVNASSVYLQKIKVKKGAFGTPNFFTGNTFK